MEKKIVTQALADRILELLMAQTPFPRGAFYSEVQDDFQSLFISISVDDFSEGDVEASLKRVAQILNREMPVRNDGYSWVVGLKRAGEVVDSCFGGSRAAPSWGV